MKFASDITRVPCGRTDVLIGASEAPSPEFSYGHGLDGASFHGFSKVGMFFAANRDRKIEKKIWSDLVAQRSRYHHFEFVFEIYKMGMISWL